jgi:prevent-host-death family protein
MAEVGVHQAKTTLSQLLRRVEAGEEVTILRGGIPVARLVPVTVVRRQLGQDVGKLVVPDDFDAPLDEATLERFES